MFGAKMMDFSFGYEHGVDTSYNMPMSNQEVRTRVSIYPADPFVSNGPRWTSYSSIEGHVTKKDKI